MRLKSLKNVVVITSLLTITGMCACKKEGHPNTVNPSSVRIDSFSPDTATVDDLVTIQGSNFGSQPEENRVMVQSTLLTVIAGNSNSITVKVPARSASGKIDVTVNGHTSESVQNFTYLATVRTLSGDGTLGSNNGDGDKSQFRFPSGIATDAEGNLYVADRNSNLIRKVTLQGITSTVAGDGAMGLVNGNAAQSRFNLPSDVVVDEVGNVFIADAGNHCIRKITPDGFVSTFAGTGAEGYKDGPGGQAMFDTPTGITLDANENVYVTDEKNNVIRKITAGGIVSTIAGTGVIGFKDGDAKSEAQFNTPFSLDIDALGNLYVADVGNFRIRKISKEGMVTTWAGTGVNGTKDGNKAEAQFGIITGVKLDPWGNMYVVDLFNSMLRKITVDGTVSTVTGENGNGFVDARADKAKFKSPLDVAIDHFGNVFVSDRENQRIRILQ